MEWRGAAGKTRRPSPSRTTTTKTRPLRTDQIGFKENFVSWLQTTSSCRELLAFIVKQIGLPRTAFGADTTLGYAEKARHTGGAAGVTDVTHTAALLGNHIPSTLVTGADGHGDGLVTVAPYRASRH
jgi:hypothetical protein